MKNLLTNIAALFLCGAVYAGPYYGITQSTVTGKATEYISGEIRIAASSATASTAVITLNGEMQTVTAPKMTFSTATAPSGTLVFNGTVITSTATELVLQQSGDTYGITKLRLRSRDGSAGALFESAGLDLVDFGFKGNSGAQNNIRMEHRTSSLSSSLNTGGEFQFLFPNSTIWFASGRARTNLLSGSLYVVNGGISAATAAFSDAVSAGSTLTVAGPFVSYSGILSSATVDGFTVPSGAGTRFMWIPSSGAFRAGYVDLAQWNPTSIGVYSFSSGKSNTASGIYSVSMGNGNSASGNCAVAIGNSGSASGSNSVALGYATTASNSGSLSAGYYTQATGAGAVSFGTGQSYSRRLTASGVSAIAVGYMTSAGTFTVAGIGSVGMGQDIQTTANNALAFGRGLIANTTDTFNVGFGTALTTPTFQVTASSVNISTPLVVAATVTANGASIATAEIATATVTGYADVGVYVSKYSATATALYAACATGYVAIAGGCHSPYGAIKSSVPSSETVSGSGTPAGMLEGDRIGTAWGCVLESSSGATASAICAKVR